MKWLICLPVKDGFGPAVVSSKDQCSECGRVVWRATQSPALEILCIHCALSLAQKSREEIEIAAPDLKQLRDIQRRLAQHQN